MNDSREVVVKVLIYATSKEGLLVFDEPDFPTVPIQVPGGTVDADEPIEVAAYREFHEETGIDQPYGMTSLGAQDFQVVRDGKKVTHQRHYFQLPLDPGKTLPDRWTHYEKHASDGSPPIRFCFFWMSLEEAEKRLGPGMSALLGHVFIQGVK